MKMIIVDHYLDVDVNRSRRRHGHKCTKYDMSR